MRLNYKTFFYKDSMIKEMKLERAENAFQAPEKPLQWSAKMRESFAEAERGEVYSRNLNDLLNV